MKVSVIVPIYNALNDIKTLIESLKINFNFTLGEIILIDDCSQSETNKYLTDISKQYSQFTVLHNKENLGFIKTCNKGMKIAKNDIVILLNSDTKIPPKFVEKIIQCFKSNSKIGIASPISSCSASYYIPLEKGTSIEDINVKLDKKHQPAYPRILAAEGFCFCIRKQVIEQLGYLDEIYGKGYHEETDFALRAQNNGWENVLIDNLYVFHARQASFGSEERQKLLQQNDKIFKQRWGAYINQINKNKTFKNPINSIYKEIFPIKYIAQKIFSIKKKDNLIIIQILGIKIIKKIQKEG